MKMTTSRTLDNDGRWRLAPGFDLTYAPSAQGERWTTVAGVGANIARHHLLALAEKVGIKAAVARRVVDQVIAATLDVDRHLAEQHCQTTISRAAAERVREASARLRG
ncbi:MAG: hypothetical protein AB8H79_11260 [Myxococcota bacterium]